MLNVVLQSVITALRVIMISGIAKRVILPDVMRPKSNAKVRAGNTKGGRMTVPLTSCLTGLESAV